VPLQVMQQIASGFKSAEVNLSNAIGGWCCACSPASLFPAPPRSRLPAWLGIG